MIENYVGDAYRSDLKGEWSENSFFEFIRLTTGRIIFDNPKFRVRTRRLGSQREISKAIQYGLNRWVRDIRLRKLLKRVYVNQCFSFSVVQSVIEPQPWQDPRPTPVFWPQCYMIEPDRFFFDPLCTWYGGARFAGHKYVRDRADLIEEAEDRPELGWNIDAIKELADDSGVETLKRGGKQSHTRKEVVLYEVWVPEVQTQDPQLGFHGTLYTIAASPGGEKGGEYVREPRPFYGPRWGPYTLFGVYPVPGDPYPLSPFQAIRMQSQDLNDVVRSTNKAIREYKRLVLCSAENPDLALKLKKPDNIVLTVKGFAKDQVEQLELGGVTEQHMKQLELTLSRLDRNSGINQTYQGKITGATATEIAVADSSAEASLSYIKQEFADAVVQIGESAAWAMYHDDRIQFPLDEEAAMAFPDPMTGMPMNEPWFMGGAHFTQTGERFEDLECEIHPYSMERLNDALVRAQYSEMMQLALEAAAVIPTAPFFDWKRLFDKGGEVMNDPQFGEFYIPEIGSMSQQMLVQQQQMEQMQGAAAIENQQAATEGQRVNTSVTSQQPQIERVKIAPQLAGLAQKTAQKGKANK